MSELWQRSAVELAADIRRGDVGCRELMDVVLARIEQLDSHTNAFAFVDPVAARQAADEADRATASGAPLGPLHGLPISAKDLISTAGMRTAHGSHAFAGNVPAEDAEVVARLRRAGAIVFGKTTTPELGCKILTDSPLHGHTRNPWNLARTPGGSSGGAAVATAMGFGPVALTTDGAGSSRVPAACCGVLGLKPTLGAVPMELAADLFGGLSCIGLMARTAADLELLFPLIAGPSARDPWTLGASAPPAWPRERPRQGLVGLRVRSIRHVGHGALDPDVERLVAASLARMEKAGAVIIEGPSEFDWGLDACRALLRANQAARNAYLLEKWRDRLDPVLVQGVEEGLSLSAAQIRQAGLDRSALFRRVQTLFDGADVLATPAFSATPPLIGQRADEPFQVAGGSPGSLRDTWYSYTIPFNPTGHPAISVPCGIAPDGMPVGLQLIGPWHGEALLIDLASALEPMFGWREQWPALAAAARNTTEHRP
jgi:aspartyl-tRNA(Asn)/glutamyl-tRNA(Gln) amidotransferase subunit A